MSFAKGTDTTPYHHRAWCGFGQFLLCDGSSQMPLSPEKLTPSLEKVHTRLIFCIVKLYVAFVNFSCKLRKEVRKWPNWDQTEKTYTDHDKSK